MNGDTTQTRRRGGRAVPEVVAPTNRVNVALPFSTLRVEETSPELAELASIVAELSALLDKAGSTPDLHRVRDRARALAARLQ